MEGYIWFHDKLHSGTKKDFLDYRKQYSTAELIMKMYASSPEEVKAIAENLNRSNVLQQMRERS